MTSKKNMKTNRTPRSIDLNAGGRKKGRLTSLIKKYYGNKKGVHYMTEEQYNKEKQRHRDPMDIVVIK